jgi:Transposase DDE domain
LTDLCGMYFKVSMRHNPAINTSCGYYRLVESYRNYDDRVCHRTILNIGFIGHLTPERLNRIQKILTNRVEGKAEIFEEQDPLVMECVEKYWAEMIAKKRVDLPEKAQEKKKRMVDVDTIKHKEVREVGAEWIGFQGLEQLQLAKFLKSEGWSQEQVQLALTQIVSRAVYPSSELRTSSWIKENSGICEITGYPIEKITKDKLYQSALDLYSVKSRLEQFLSKKTNELFDLEDKIMLYDLTNTYFEGEKRNSKLAQYGRSKEKRNDAKIVVLAMVVNPEGFIKYSNIFEGNMTDSKSLVEIIDNLRSATSEHQKRAMVVIDAGIATEENLTLLTEKGYDYLCVSRSKLKDYKPAEGCTPQHVVTKNNQTLGLQRVTNDSITDYYLEVKSPGKVLKETSMKNAFETRFEQEMEKIKVGLTKKNAVKKFDKINQRIGRAIQKYPSVSKYYKIDVQSDAKGLTTKLEYSKDADAHQKVLDGLGIYFIRTNITITQEDKLWMAYNTIREIESSFRTLKTDLDLRPIYHKNDTSTMAHLHLGLLAYWLVNTIRYQLKQKGINNNWQEIVRKGNTQKMVTTHAKNQLEEIIEIQRCSEPNAAIKEIYDALKYKSYPFTKRKSVVHSSELKNFETLILRQKPPS